MADTQNTMTAVAVRRSTDLAGLDEFNRILQGGEFDVEIIDDPALISRQIIAELLSSTTDEELESFGTAEGWTDYEGVPMTIHGFNWRPSTIDNPDGGAGIYVVVFATDGESGEDHVLTCGSLNVMAQLSNLASRGRIPGCVRILKRAEQKTRSGFYPLMLVSTEAEIAERKAAKATETPSK